VNKEAALRKEAMGKNQKQPTSAIKPMKQRGRAALENGVGIGALVLLKVDYRTHCHAQGLFAIVYRFNTDTGGILVCCKHGVVTHDGSSNSSNALRQVQSYCNKHSTFPMSNKLQGVHDKVLAGNFVDDAGTQIISFFKYVDIDLGSASPVKKAKGCSFKRGCKKGCGCKTKGLRCHSGYTCNVNCG
jgi:hypothetical protein